MLVPLIIASLALAELLGIMYVKSCAHSTIVTSLSRRPLQYSTAINHQRTELGPISTKMDKMKVKDNNGLHMMTTRSIASSRLQWYILERHQILSFKQLPLFVTTKPEPIWENIMPMMVSNSAMACPSILVTTTRRSAGPRAMVSKLIVTSSSADETDRC